MVHFIETTNMHVRKRHILFLNQLCQQLLINN